MSKHTPGPWESNGHEVRRHCTPGACLVAVVKDLKDTSLIAEAPALLHYLKVEQGGGFRD